MIYIYIYTKEQNASLLLSHLIFKDKIPYVISEKLLKPAIEILIIFMELTTRNEKWRQFHCQPQQLK